MENLKRDRENLGPPNSTPYPYAWTLFLQLIFTTAPIQSTHYCNPLKFSKVIKMTYLIDHLTSKEECFVVRQLFLAL